MIKEEIVVRGAREHNLKNINVKIPKNKLVVFTGISGSGKSSLAFDTIYAEGQRRYVESLSSYARQFLGIMAKPDCDLIEGLSPAISIDQKVTSHNPRSTVGTVTEIYDYLRLLFARIGHPHCPNCGREISQQSAQQIVEQVILKTKELVKLKKQIRLMILAPVVRDRKGEFRELLSSLRQKGYVKARIDHQILSLDQDLGLIKTNKHMIEAVVDRLSLDPKMFKSKASLSSLKTRLTESVENGLNLADGLVIISQVNDTGFDFPEKPKKMKDYLFSQKYACPDCNLSLPEIEPRSFSFNLPHGACPACNGIGTLLKVDPELVINPNLSLAEGGIFPFARLIAKDTWFARLLKTVAQKNGLDLTRPLKEATPKQIKALLNGSGDQIYQVQGENRYGRLTKIYEVWPGVIGELERRYAETESDYVRSEIERYMRKEVCPECQGARLKKEALSITIDQKSIVEIADLAVKEALGWIKKISDSEMISEKEKTIGQPIFKEIENRLGFLVSVGLDYLTLNRPAGTLSGGEAQRIRLASQIGSSLSGVLYVLDEPTIGLHLRDNRKLIKTLKDLRDLGNTVIVVEHDREMMEEAGFILDFGPGGGEKGGSIVAQGTSSQIKKNKKSLTGKYLSGKKKIRLVGGNKLARNKDKKITIKGCRQFNLKNIDVSFPLGHLICITGVSGSGKSTLINETFYHALARRLSHLHREKPGEYDLMEGEENIDRVLFIDQSPIGKTPRSNPATYTGAFTFIRQLFAKTSEARVRGYKLGRFSFNVSGGRCQACQGGGQIKIEMQFLPDVYVECEVCQGSRYNSETLEVRYKGKNIAEILAMSVVEALPFFKNIPGLSDKLATLADVGLGYLHLGQPAPTLSGGEAQRIKLASELAKRSTGKTVYLLDEPTVGLHFEDLNKLLFVLKKLVDQGNTVIIIEHNLDVIKNADWIIDLGPEGGSKGGQIVGEGSPRQLAENKKSYTGQFLKRVIK